MDGAVMNTGISGMLFLCFSFTGHSPQGRAGCHIQAENPEKMVEHGPIMQFSDLA